LLGSVSVEIAITLFLQFDRKHPLLQGGCTEENINWPLLKRLATGNVGANSPAQL
jgi:hypothetical protein